MKIINNNNMRLSLLTICIIIFSSISHAEKYACAYFFNGQAKPLTFERQGQYFVKSNKAMDKITFEDNQSIILQAYYNSNNKPMSFQTLIDKINANFVMVGLKYNGSTSVIQGKCKIY